MGLVTNIFVIMKAIIYLFSILGVALISSCSSVENKKGDEFQLKLRVIDKYPDRALVTEFVNNSNNDYCILGFYDIDIYYLYVDSISGDTSWFIEEFFYLRNKTSLPVYKPEMEFTENNDLYELNDSYNIYPEFESCYDSLRRMIKETYDKDKSEFYQVKLALIFNPSVFVRANEVFRDTISFGNYFQKAPNTILKFSLTYPKQMRTWNYKAISLNDFLFNLQDELKFELPNTFDGFKVLTDEIEFSDSVIVQQSK